MNGSLNLSANASITCDGNAKIIFYSSTGTVPVYVSSSSIYDLNDFVGTNLTNLTYIKDSIASKDYFKSNGVYYTFNGSKFTEVAENPATIDLQQLCTRYIDLEGFSSDIKFSQAAYKAYMDDVNDSDAILKTGLKGYTIDG